MTGLADRQDGQDFYTLLLGATLGMCLMASANHLMTVFLAVEMASVPSYVLAGILKGRRRASEAALKYAVYGAGAAGVMLYGISLLAGLTRLGPLADDRRQACRHGYSRSHRRRQRRRYAHGARPRRPDDHGRSGVQALGRAVPLLVPGRVRRRLGRSRCVPLRRVEGRGHGPSGPRRHRHRHRTNRGAGNRSVPLSPPVLAQTVPAHAVAFQQPAPGEAASAAGKSAPLAPVRRFIVLLLAVVAAVTCTFGNLAAYGQTNIKRMLAYSTIAHAGYMLMAVAAAVQLAGTNATDAREAVAALLFYLTAYVFMNLGAFAIVAFLRNTIGSEEIADYAGLIRSAPLTAVALTAILVSLIGIPPMVGFMGKFAIFQSLVVAGGPWMIGLLVIAGINTAVSLIYYLRVAKVVCIDAAPAERGPVSIGILPAVYVLVVALPVLIYGIIPERVLEVARQASQQLFM